jgi:class 3 adenylate cyclase/alpha-beta hydrolase superfamily lysophospholipase
MIPITRYASRDGVDLAYKVFGDGPRDVVLAFAFVSNVEVFCELAEHLEFVDRLQALGARVIMFDKRGTGLSDRSASGATIEEHADDLVAVMDAAGSTRAALIGWFDGGAICLVAAARHPDRVESVIAYEVMAVGHADEDFPWALDTAWVASIMRGVEAAAWGSGIVTEEVWAAEGDGRVAAWWRRYESMSATPSGARRLAEGIQRLDIRAHLEHVRAPVLVLHDADLAGIDTDALGWLADHLPDGRMKLIRRRAALPPIIPTGDLVDEMEEFLGGTRTGGLRDVLTIVFTDIVESTAGLARAGDEQWRSLLASHDDALRRAIARYAGSEVNTTGDGIVATFALPSSALHFARDAMADAAALGLSLRIGLNAGEVIARGDELVGIAVHAAARICSASEPGRILVGDPVRMLVVGSAFAFEDAGEHELKGVPGRWRLWFLATAVPDASAARA